MQTHSPAWIAVPGQPVFVSTSPSGELVAVGTLHERHTPTMHAVLAEETNIEPEEDVDISLFDQNFGLLLTFSPVVRPASTCSLRNWRNPGQLLWS